MPFFIVMKLFISTFLMLAAAFAVAGQAPSKIIGLEIADATSRPNGTLTAEAQTFHDGMFGDPRFVEGATETFRIAKSSSRSQIEAALRSNGWDYDITGTIADGTIFTAVKRSPVRINIYGIWLTSGRELLLRITEIKVDKSRAAPDPAISNNSTSPISAPGAKSFSIPAKINYVNLMGDEMPVMPAFPKLAPTKGKLRGYVKDMAGKPLQGAYIGVRSTLVGGTYSGASAESDAKGYYEIVVPYGAAHFYAAGYTIDYGGSRAAVSLHPADGNANSFASGDGSVENFVLIPYGIADRDAYAEKPFFSSTYYGGSISCEYNLDTGDMFSSEGSLPVNSEIVFTLTGESLWTGEKRSFVVKRKVSNDFSQFMIGNIPIGSYRISAKLSDGRRLKISEPRYKNLPAFGLGEQNSDGSFNMLLMPSDVKALYGKPNYGKWDAVGLKVKL